MIVIIIAHMVCLGYSFISFVLMIKAGVTAKALPTDFAYDVIRAFGWPTALIHWIRFERIEAKAANGHNEIYVGEYKPLAADFRPTGGRLDKNDQLMYKKGLPKIDPLDFAVDEVVFYVKDEDPNVHTDPTAVVNLKGDLI